MRDEDNNYIVEVINGPGPGNRIMVRKQWLDDNDAQHRLPVQVEVYDKEKNTKVAGPVTVGNDGTWQRLIGIGEASPSNVYVKEVSIGEAADGSEGQYKVEEAPTGTFPEDDNPQPRYICQTGHHIYEVTSDSDPVNLEGTYFYTTRNRRLGKIDLTVTKQWKDGDGERRRQLKQKLDEINRDETILYPAFELQFVENDREDYKMTQLYPNTEGDWIQVGVEWVQIQDENEKPMRSVQEIELDQPNNGGDLKQILQFYNLPKYDSSGQVVHYQVREVWVLQEPGDTEPKTLTRAQLADKYEEIYELVRPYQVSYKETYKVESATHERDEQNITVTNSLQGTKTLLWHKQWMDSANNDAKQRPDLYLNIYSYGYDETGKQKVKLVRKNYHWEDSSGGLAGEVGARYDSSRHWHVLLEDMPKYDSEGYELIYYAVEHTSVDASSFGYTDVRYSAPYREGSLTEPGEEANLEEEAAGTPKPIGTVKQPSEEGAADSVQAMNGWMLDVSDQEAETAAGFNWALAENGTFNNHLDGTISIAGRKNWNSLPAGFDAADLPRVDFELRRYVKADDMNRDEADKNGRVWDKNRAAWFTINTKDWETLYSNGSYRFTIEYEGENQLDGTKFKPAVESEETKKLPKYDEEGRLYYYVLRETSMGEKGEWSGSFQNGAIFETTTEEGTYIVNNRFKEEQGGSITIRKLLARPTGTGDGDTTAYPAVPFRLYRRYTKADRTKSDWTFVKSAVWQASEVKEAFANPDTEWAEWSETFENLAVFAPNGSRYEYLAAEVRTDLAGYDTWVDTETVAKETVEDYVKDKAPAQPSAFPDGTSGQTMVTTERENDSQTLRAATSSDALATPSQATFINRRNLDDKVIIQGDKRWEDFNDVFQLRPASDSNAKSGAISKALEDAGFTFSLWRKANAQPGQGNEIELHKIPESDYTITWTRDTEDPNLWSYKIQAAAGKSLDRYAPNGMLWLYEVHEKDENPDYRMIPSSGVVDLAKSPEEDAETGAWILKMDTLTNSLQYADKRYKKKWEDKYGNSIEEDYLGYKLQVEFTLQVAEYTGDLQNPESLQLETNWQDAETYFKENLSDTIFDTRDFTAYIPKNEGASVTNECWNGTYKFTGLPQTIKKKNEENTTTHLLYRVVETEIRYGGADADFGEPGNYKTVTVTAPKDTQLNYRYKFDSYDLFSPAYASNSNAEPNHNHFTTITHINRIQTADFAVTKNWAGDQKNIYGTRPDTSRENYEWETCFVIQRSTDDGKTWSDVINSEDSSPLIVWLTGTGESGTLNITGLPKTDAEGKEYAYRARELEPREHRYNDGRINKPEDVIEQGEGYYENAYTASYSNASSGSASGGEEVGTASPSTVVTNTLRTRDVQVTKNWRGDDKTNVTLELQYLKASPSDAQNPADMDWISFDGNAATVVLDGNVDEKSADRPGYESDEWVATWNAVPQYMPGSYQGETGNEPTQYRVVEKLNGGEFIPIDGSVATPSQATSPDDDLEFAFTNTAAVSLTVKKVWGVPASFDKQAVTAEIWRTTGTLDADVEVPNFEAPEFERVAKDKINGTADSGSQYTVTLEGDLWTETITGLPKYDADGHAYTYFALERSVGEEPGVVVENDPQKGTSSIDFEKSGIQSIHHSHTASENRFSSTIYNIGSFDLTVKKHWADNGNAYETRPDTLTLTIYCYAGKPEDYTAPGNGWEEVGIVPQPTPDKGAEGSNTWVYTYEDLPYANEKGTPYTYQAIEGKPEVASPSEASRGTTYDPEYSKDHLEITNRLNGTTELAVTKNWKDSSDADGRRPTTIELTLYQRQEGSSNAWVKCEAEGVTNPVTINSGGLVTRLMNFLTGNTNQWEYTFANLPKFNGEGAMYEYKVEETVPDGYYPETVTEGDAANGFTTTITNTLITKVPVRKVWGDVPSDDQEAVTVGLYQSVNGRTPVPVTNADTVGYAGSEPEKELTLVLNAGNSWCDDETFTNLPRFTEGGEKITYTVKELLIGDEPAEDSGYIIHYTPEEQASDE